MAKCKYPNEVCANMTVLNGNTYCDSVPCSLKDEIPKQTNADRIRAMSDEELAIMLMCPAEYDESFNKNKDCNGEMNKNCKECTLNWLQSEAE